MNYEAAWDAVAPGWILFVRQGGTGPRTAILRPELQRLLGDVKGLRVLDVGCGEGDLSRWLADQGATVTGADIAEAMLHAAKAEEERRPKGITYLKSSITHLAGDGAFDVILANQVLSIVPDHAAALASLAGALKPSGSLIATVTHPFFDGVGPGWVVHADGEVRWHTHRYMSRVEGRAAHGAPTFHRSLTDYIGSAIAAGFVLTGFAEVTASDEVSRTLPPWQRPFDQVPVLAVMRFRLERR